MREAADKLNGWSLPRHQATTSEVSSESPRSSNMDPLPPPPPRLYKYLRRDHAEALVALGSTRIGTLRDFRNEEKYGKGIGDATEGIKEIRARLNRKFDSGTPETAALNELGAVFIGEGCRNISFVDVALHSRHAQPNALIWCCSTALSTDALSSIDATYACVEIFDVAGFFDALDQAVRSHFSDYADLEKFGPSPVSYRSRIETWNERDLGLNPVFIKEDIPVFTSQREVRAAWLNPNSLDIAFKADILPTSDCNQFCRIVDDAELR